LQSGQTGVNKNWFKTTGGVIMHIVSPNNRQAVSFRVLAIEETTIGKDNQPSMKITLKRL